MYSVLSLLCTCTVCYHCYVHVQCVITVMYMYSVLSLLCTCTVCYHCYVHVQCVITVMYMYSVLSLLCTCTVCYHCYVHVQCVITVMYMYSVLSLLCTWCVLTSPHFSSFYDNEKGVVFEKKKKDIKQFGPKSSKMAVVIKLSRCSMLGGLFRKNFGEHDDRASALWYHFLAERQWWLCFS